MTIICYRDGIMAADSATFSSDVIVSTGNKIIRTASGGLIATCGKNVDCRAVRAWVAADCLGPPPPLKDPSAEDFGAIYVKADRSVFVIQSDMILQPVNADFHANGYCRDIAFGAMAAGASAEFAVAICLKYGQGVGGPILVMKL